MSKRQRLDGKRPRSSSKSFGDVSRALLAHILSFLGIQDHFRSSGVNRAFQSSSLLTLSFPRLLSLANLSVRTLMVVMRKIVAIKLRPEAIVLTGCSVDIAAVVLATCLGSRISQLSLTVSGVAQLARHTGPPGRHRDWCEAIPASAPLRTVSIRDAGPLGMGALDWLTPLCQRFPHITFLSIFGLDLMPIGRAPDKWALFAKLPLTGLALDSFGPSHSDSFCLMRNAQLKSLLLFEARTWATAHCNVIATMPLIELCLGNAKLLTDSDLATLATLQLTALRLTEAERVTTVGFETICRFPLRSLTLRGMGTLLTTVTLAKLATVISLTSLQLPAADGDCGTMDRVPPEDHVSVESLVRLPLTELDLGAVCVDPRDLPLLAYMASLRKLNLSRANQSVACGTRRLEPEARAGMQMMQRLWRQCNGCSTGRTRSFDSPESDSDSD